jgi:hypothetical protein
MLAIICTVYHTKKATDPKNSICVGLLPIAGKYRNSLVFKGHSATAANILTYEPTISSGNLLAAANQPTMLLPPYQEPMLKSRHLH